MYALLMHDLNFYHSTVSVQNVEKLQLFESKCETVV